MLWDCVPGTLGGHLSQTCRFCVVTLPGLKMGVGVPAKQAEATAPTLISSLRDSTSVCLSVCKALFWGLEHPLPATLAAAELQHRPPGASASQLTCAFQLLGCLCGSGSPWHGRHGSSEPEEGSLSCHPARFHSGLEIGA